MQLLIDVRPFARRPSDRVELALYRVAHEAAMNALKHAATDAVRVEMAEYDGGILLVVSDHGVGFDPATVGATSGRRALGLLGMRERVELLDGRFAIRSACGEGTTVTVWMPSGDRERAQVRDA